MSDDLRIAIEKLVTDSSPETQRLIAEVFAIEKTKLYMSQPFRIVDEVTDVVKEIVR